jgi:hypothetical protein
VIPKELVSNSNNPRGAEKERKEGRESKREQGGK